MAQARGQAVQHRLIQVARGIVIGVCLTGAGGQRQQHAADPAFGAGAQLIEAVIVQGDMAGAGQRGYLLAVQGQVGGVEFEQLLVTVQLGDGQLWFALTGGDNLQPGCRQCQQAVDQLARRVAAQQVQVVNKQHQWRLAGFQLVEQCGFLMRRIAGRHRQQRG